MWHLPITCPYYIAPVAGCKTHRSPINWQREVKIILVHLAEIHVGQFFQPSLGSFNRFALLAIASRAGNSLICSSLIRSFAHSLIRWFVDLLVLLKSNDRLLAIRSRQMSDRDWIAQVVQRKWATVSKSLRSHDKWSNEQFAIKILAKKSKIIFLVCFIYV